MKYQLTKEINDISLELKSEEGQKVIFDKLEFPVMPRENFRMELQKELKGVVQQEAGISAEGLIKYNGLEKYEGQIYLSRECNQKFGLELFQTNEPEEICRILIQILNYIKLYHSQDIILGGLSLGELAQDKKGNFFLLDPIVINHLSKFLTSKYRIDTSPEVIKGNKWDQKSDVFSWGVLAYRLLSEVDPYAADTTEERMEKILKIGPPNLKDLRPELSVELSSLIMSSLDNDPRRRPSLESLISKLTVLIESAKLTVSESEAREYREKATKNRRLYKSKEQLWLWFRKYGFVTLSALGVIGFFIFTWVGSQGKPIITEKNKPLEVLNYYFEGVKTLNPSLIDESLYKVKNSFSDMVTNLFVINRTQQGMSHSLKDSVKLDFVGLNVETLIENSSEAKYQAKYTLQVAMAKEINYFEREEEYTLKPVKKVWRVTGINILKENHRIEKLPEEQNPVQGNELQLPAVSGTK